MLGKHEQEILKAVTEQKTTPATQKFPIYYQENGNLIRENADGTKYIIKLDKNNQEQIVRKI